METHKERISRNIQHDRTSLAAQCRVLSEHMIVLANRLESDRPHINLCVNDLGEIQSMGTIIDASCGRLMGKIMIWKQMKEID